MGFKTKIKWWLASVGVWYMLDFLRRLPHLVRWLSGGCAGCAPAPIKRMIVRSYLREHNIRNFVETGTYLGDTLAYVASHGGTRCVSIELSRELYDSAKRRFAGWANVKVLQGDSASVLARLINEIEEPTLFWLDGHYSAGVTAQGALHTPVSAELDSVLSHRIKSHVILIDDARYFDGTNDYPPLGALLERIRQHGTYRAEVSADIIRLLPDARS